MKFLYFRSLDSVKKYRIFESYNFLWIFGGLL